MTDDGGITGHGFPAINPLAPSERIVIREVADGAGPSHLVAIGGHLLVVDPWAAAIRRYALADMDAPPVIATMPRSFAPWRTRRSGDAVVLIAEPFGPEEDDSYHLRPRTMMTITRPLVAAITDGEPCGFSIGACDPLSAEPTNIGLRHPATIAPVGGASAEVHAIRYAGSLSRGRALLWWSEVDDAVGSDDYAGRVTASQYVGIFSETGGKPDAVIRLQTAAYAPLVAGAAIPEPTLLVKPGFECVIGTTDGTRDMLWVMAADAAGTQNPAFVLLGYPLDTLGGWARALVSLVEGGSEEIDRNDPTATGQITVPTPAGHPPVGPRKAWFEAARARLERQIVYRWRYPRVAQDRPCEGADLCAIGANTDGALGVGDGFAAPVVDKIDTSGRAQWMRPRQLIGVAAGECLRGVPYSIGGFDLADSFAERLAAGYDGNEPYPPPIGHIREGLEWPGQAEHYPLGIDCSALVARIFDIAVRSTAEMVAAVDLVTADGRTYQVPRGPDHSCAEPVRYLRDIQPGDVLLRDGHIVIFSGPMQVDGGRAMRVFEASSRTGRVCESVYDPTFFDGWWIMRMRLDGEGIARAGSMRAVGMTRYDALVIGGGHNGLVCAFYLARAGLKVRVLERRHIVGGAAVTEEFHPGFRNSTASYTVSLLRPKVIADMKLHARGFRIIERTISNFFPFADTYLKLAGGIVRTQAEFARFSARDADAYPRYDAALEKVAQVLRDLALKTPPNAGGGLRALLAGAAQGLPLARMDIEAQRDLLDVFTKSARDFLDGWFEDDRVKTAFAFDAVVGNYAGVSTPGSAYVLLHHVFGEVNGKYGAWGHSVGGMGAITQAMARACQEAGVEISLEAPVAKVLSDGGKVAGVRLESGEEIAAKIVAANVGPALLYRQMVDAADMPADFKRRIAGYKTGSGTFRMNVALSELPDFTVLPGKDKAEHHTAGIIIAPGLDYMDRAYDDARAFGWSKQPIVEMKLPTTVDDSLAPPGQHIASLFCQQFAPQLPDGRSWDDAREEAADLIIDTVTAHAPNFKASIIARQIHSPLDLERKFGLVGGDIFHGAMGLDQLWAARPVLGHGDYRGPIAGLYMCGSGTHPGGGVTGAPGHNAAHEILRDRSILGRLFG